MKFKKYGKTPQFRNVVRTVGKQADFKGLDDEDNAIYESSKKPIITFTGTVKLHGSNAMVTYDGKNLKAGKRSSFIEESDLTQHFGFSNFVYNIHRDFFEKVMADLHKTFAKKDQEITLYGEFAGCFEYSTPILLTDGTTRNIGQIVNNKEEVEVLSYNVKTNKLESKKVTNWFRNGKTEEWLKIKYRKRKRGGKSPSLRVTPNHKIFTKIDNRVVDIPASDLKKGDILYTNGSIISINQLDFIKGSILGDGSISDKRHFTVAHSENVQSFYNTFIEKLMKNIGSTYERVSGHGSPMKGVFSKSLNEVEDIYNSIYINKTKIPNTEYLNTLNNKSLAVWYMDDGTLNIHKGKNRQPLASLMTLGWDKECNNTISKWLISRGYDNYICADNSYQTTRYFIKFTPKGTVRFLTDISYYMLPEFDYKLPKYLRKKEKFNWFDTYGEYEKGLVETIVTDISKYTPKEEYKKVKYDLEVEDNHNYFANRILVHNSGIQKGVGISEFDKSFYFFALRVYDKNTEESEWIDISNLHRNVEEPNIYNIYDFPTFSVDVDFNKPDYAVNKFVELVEEVENECPVSKQLGKPNTIGEGIVWTGWWNDQKFIFKTKGKKHSVIKSKKVVSVDPEVLKNIEEFVNYAVTPNRVKQAVQETGADSRKNTGDVIRWVCGDILTEESDVLEKNNLIWKQVASEVTRRTQEYFFEELDKF